MIPLMSHQKGNVKKNPQLSDAIRARLGPQTPGNNRHTATAQGAYPRPSNVPISQGYAPHQPT